MKELKRAKCLGENHKISGNFATKTKNVGLFGDFFDKFVLTMREIE